MNKQRVTFPADIWIYTNSISQTGFDNLKRKMKQYKIKNMITYAKWIHKKI